MFYGNKLDETVEGIKSCNSKLQCAASVNARTCRELDKQQRFTASCRFICWVVVAIASCIATSALLLSSAYVMEKLDNIIVFSKSFTSNQKIDSRHEDIQEYEKETILSSKLHRDHSESIRSRRITSRALKPVSLIWKRETLAGYGNFSDESPLLAMARDDSEIFGERSVFEETITYFPGQLTVKQNGMRLSTGLTSRLVAATGKVVQYSNLGTSRSRFHYHPDGAATFLDTSPSNEGGWIYVSNSEDRNRDKRGGVGAITFNKDGDIIDYRMVLTRTRSNCGGVKTPWGSWISCEERSSGKIWQVDPKGVRPAAKITMGSNTPGRFEAVAYDLINKDIPRFFVTKDDEEGELTRFTPSNPNWTDPWNILYGPGTFEYLVLSPTSDDGGRFEWVSDIKKGIASADKHFGNAEGIDFMGDELFFVSKKERRLFILNVVSFTYSKVSTSSGLFSGEPDQILHIENSLSDVMYFMEDHSKNAGVHGRNRQGQYFTVLESETLAGETTGLAFSPDKKHMYVAYQEIGKVFDITRTDLQPFDGKVAGIEYN